MHNKMKSYLMKKKHIFSKQHVCEKNAIFAQKRQPHFYVLLSIELINNKLYGLLPLGGFVSPPGGSASLLFDQGVP